LSVYRSYQQGIEETEIPAGEGLRILLPDKRPLGEKLTGGLFRTGYFYSLWQRMSIRRFHFPPAPLSA
jgi:hypothetical protein